MRRLIHAVALEPKYAKQGIKVFVCGGRHKLVLVVEGWLGHKETLVHSGDACEVGRLVNCLAR
jgi:hypothetical protein